MEQEADYLCGAPLFARTPNRTNYRLGYYRRKQRTPIGRFPVRVPHLLYFVPRVPIPKRAKRLTPQILDTLASILGSARVPRAASGVSPDACLGLGRDAQASTRDACAPQDIHVASASLIRAVWTLDLPDALLAKLSAQLLPILDQWRRASGASGAVEGESLSPHHPGPASAPNSAPLNLISNLNPPPKAAAASFAVY